MSPPGKIVDVNQAEKFLRKFQVSGLRVYYAPCSMSEDMKTMTPLPTRDTTVIHSRVENYTPQMIGIIRRSVFPRKHEVIFTVPLRLLFVG